MRRLLLAAALLTIVASLLGLPRVTAPRQAAAQSAGDQQPARLIRKAMTQLERGEPADEAARMLLQAGERLPEGHIARDTALLLHHQITGGYAERLKPWLDREVADIVVLVDDEVSFLDAVDQWTDDTFWPVLMDDDWYAPLFVEAFRPEKVIRWESDRAEQADDGDARLRALATAVRDHNQRVTSREDEAIPPPGLVVLDPRGRQRQAGYALARAHQQPILALAARGSVNRPTTEKAVAQMNDQIMRALRATDILPARGWPAITLAGDYPYKYETPDGENNPQGVDDRLGRDDELHRRAYTGRLLGDEVQAVYQAMGALFIQPRRPLLLNGYWAHDNPEPSQAKAWYHLSTVADRLGEHYDVTLIQNDREAVESFREQANPLPIFDWWWVNSAHGTSSLAMPGESFQVDDTPLGRAMPMYVVASFSARNPWNEQELSGLALRGGAFWYFGSTHEPYLQAFVQSNLLISRMAFGTPIGAAARQTAGHPFGKPWKLMLVGDPLFTLRKEPAERIAPPESIEGEPIEPGTHDDDAPLGERLVDAALVRHPSASADLLDAAVEQFASLTYDQRAQAARLLHRQGRGSELMALPREQVRRHPVSLTLTRRMFRDRFTDELAEQQLDAARATLTELHNLRLSPGHFRMLARRWLTAMHEADRGTEGDRFLRNLADSTDSSYRRRKIEEVIDQVQEQRDG